MSLETTSFKVGYFYRAIGTISAGSFVPTQWVAVSSASGFLPISGGTMTGTLTLVSDPSGLNDAATKHYVDNSVSLGSVVNPNRLINGDMRIDQRGFASAGGVTGAGYTIDRWAYSGTQAGKVWVFRSGGAPSGFAYTLNPISQSAYTVTASDAFYIQQAIEADQITDFAWGPSSTNPQTVTLSFWALTQTPLTGTFSGAICNYPASGPPTRSYPFTFFIPTATLWTKFVINIPADIIGTWVMSGNGGGAYVRFDLGSGSTFRGAANTWANGNLCGATGSTNLVATTSAQLYITGVKLEVGSVATAFPVESLAKKLIDCQRYFCKTYNANVAPRTASTESTALGVYLGPTADATCSLGVNWAFPVTMRVAPTVTTASPHTGLGGWAGGESFWR